MTDAIGDRMKRQYEDRTRYYLPWRTYTVVRVDGKAFHQWTSRLERPFDSGFMSDMDMTARDLVAYMQGAKLAYVQSDEISVVLTDFDTESTEAWFDGNLQKIASVAASIATARFNRFTFQRDPADYLSYPAALFDGRAFTIPDRIEVTNYLVWRQKDWERNSLQMLARHHYPHKDLLNKGKAELHEMLFEAGVNWADQPAGIRNGRLVMRDAVGSLFVDPAPVFTQDGRAILLQILPEMPRWEMALV